jgi:hypothetical protein
MSRETVRAKRTVIVLTSLVLLMAGAASAQTPTPAPTPTPTPQVTPLAVAPLPFFALDVRAGFITMGTDTTTAADLAVDARDMPSRAKTVVIGANFYLLRRGGFKLGLGAEAIRGVASNRRLDSTGTETGPVIRRRIEGMSGQISLNFGKGKGWSYLTVGGGPMKFDSYLDEAKPTRAGTTSLNYGGGARWSFKSHLALNVDLRLYLTRPADATFDAPGRVRKRLALLSAGISFK